LRRRSGFARPYIAVLSCLMRFTVPSTAPELYSRISPATSVQVAAQPGGERVQHRQVGVDGAHPLGDLHLDLEPFHRQPGS